MVKSGSSILKPKWLQRWWNSLNSLSRLLVIVLAAPSVVVNAWALAAIFRYFQSLLVILLVTAVLAFLLSYPVRWLEKNGLRRAQATILVFLVTLLIFMAVGIILLPLAFTQAQQLVVRLPDWLDSGQLQLTKLNDWVNALGLPISLDDGAIAQINSRVGTELQRLAGRSLNIALNLTVLTVVRLLDVLLTIILTFYLVLHSDNIWQSLINWLPKRIRDPFSETLRLSFENYFLAQIISATCMASGLVCGFLLLKVPFGLLFGLTIGAMALIPFGGSVGIATVTLLVALQDIGLALRVLAVALVVQQIVENGIAPKILGSVTGLNPFWVLIALLAGARVGGLLGVIVAVPSAVLIKEALEVLRTAYAIEELPPKQTVHEDSHFSSDDLPSKASATEESNPIDKSRA